MPHAPVAIDPVDRSALSGTRRRASASVVSRRAASLALLGMLAAAGRSGANPPNAAAAVDVGGTLPDVTLLGLNGPSRRLASFAGRPLIINVWASWCGPCRAEAASLERFTWSDAGLAYTVIGISTDDDRAAAEQWLKRSNATLSHFIDRAQVLENMLGASRIPLTVLVDPRGRVVAKVQGAREWDTAESVRLVERAFADFRSGQPRRPR